MEIILHRIVIRIKCYIKYLVLYLAPSVLYIMANHKNDDSNNLDGDQPVLYKFMWCFVVVFFPFNIVASKEINNVSCRIN